MHVLLALYSDPDAHHYGLDIARSSGIATGTIYPILARFEADGWVSSEWEAVDPTREGRPRRRYYRLTSLGLEAAAADLRAARERPVMQPLGLPGFGVS